MSEHIVIIHRWRDRQALYQDYIDHDAHRVSYVTTELGVAFRAGRAPRAVHVVPATDRVPDVLGAVGELTALYGRPTRRRRPQRGRSGHRGAGSGSTLGCGGQDTRRLARFRGQAGDGRRRLRRRHPGPAYARRPRRGGRPGLRRETRLAADRQAQERHGQQGRRPPRLGGGPAALRSPPPEPRLVPGVPRRRRVYHVDGLWTGDRLGPWRASRYVNTCVGFTKGDALGSGRGRRRRACCRRWSEFTAAVAGRSATSPGSSTTRCSSAPPSAAVPG